MHPAGLAERLHAARDVHGRAPDVERELALADDAGHRRPGVNADAQFHLHAVGRAKPADLLQHGAGLQHRGLGVIRPRIGQAEGRHVGVADGLDLLGAELGRQRIEGREHRIEELHQLAGRSAGRPSA